MTHIMDSSGYPAELIKRIAENIGGGLQCFLNADTLETESIPGENYTAGWESDSRQIFNDVFKKVDAWENCIHIEPPESWVSFSIMEDFIKFHVPDGEAVKIRLLEALLRKGPFQNFKFVITGSQYKQQWFDYRQSRLEEIVREQLHPGYYEISADDEE